uniref:KIB1-4 beta-propeller domain-containing protein n=1 Tax=Oryza meridionalis TaxID=40149 RepID=A0A0E0C226_9ORYZ
MSQARCEKRALSPPRRKIPRKCKRGRTVGAVAQNGAAPWRESPWASLDGDIIRLVAEHALAGDVADYLRLPAVCRHWRSSTACPRGRSVVDPRFHPRRWILFPESHGLFPGHRKLHGWVRFFNVSTGAFARLLLPLFPDHFVIDSVDGLLLLQRDRDNAIRILHPFTGDIVEFPSLETLRPQVEPFFNSAELAYMRAMGRKEMGIFSYFNRICAALSFGPDGVITAMFVTTARCLCHLCGSAMDLVKLAEWKYMAFQGKIYAASIWVNSSPNRIFVIDTPRVEANGSASSFSLPEPKLVATCPVEKLFGFAYLVNCESEVLLIGHTDRSYSQAVVYRLADIILGRFIPLTRFGDYTIFMDERSLCVSSKAVPGIADGSLIYRHHGKFLAQYHVRSGTLSTAAEGRIEEGYRLAVVMIFGTKDKYFAGISRINGAIRQGSKAGRPVMAVASAAGDGHRSHCLLPFQRSFTHDVHVSLRLTPAAASCEAALRAHEQIRRRRGQQRRLAVAAGTSFVRSR